MNKIQNEQNLATNYLIETDGNLVDITLDNVARIEAMIKTDSGYRNSTNPNLKGSCAFCMNELKEVLINNKKVKPDEYRKIIFNAVVAVDKENSTHLNSDGCGRDEITDRIIGIKKKELLKYLSDPDGTDLRLIDIISESTHPDPNKKTKSGKNYNSRTNVSFASKFCHYACFYLFDGKNEQDNYSIYDGVLKRVIPSYAKQYNIIIKDIDSYKDYRRVIDEIINKSKSKISRNGLDHLLWYYHKGEK